MKKLASLLLYLVYLGAAVLLILYLVFWKPWVDQKRQANVPPETELPVVRHAKPDTLQKTGTLPTGKQSSFIHFDYEKPAGTIRVCAIGDSFVYGEEIGAALDYPTQLGKLFREAGYNNVEVINYGGTWHGFHQAFMIWEDIAQPMDCDFILTGPTTFHKDRDTQINHSRDNDPYYLHSLYALNQSKDDVIRIDIHGKNYAERFEDYYRFIPRPGPLLHEDLPPPLLRALLPPDKTIKNPFYVHGDTDVVTTWNILLKKIAAKSTQVILMHQYDWMANTGDELQLQNYASVKVEDYNHFPNRAPNKHVAGTGNHRIANVFFNLLTQNPAPDHETVITTDIPPGRHKAAPDISPSLDTLEIWTKHQKVGHFIYIDHRLHTPWSPSSDRYASMLNLRPTGLGLFDGVWVLLKNPVKQTSTLTLSDSEGHRINLGSLNSRVAALSLFEKQIDGFSLGYWDDLALNLDALEKTHGIRLTGHITLSLDEQLLLEGNSIPYAAELPLTAVNGIALVRTVAYSESLLEPRDVPELISLKATSGESTFDFPVATSAIARRYMPAIHGSMAKVICRSGSQGVISPTHACKH